MSHPVTRRIGVIGHGAVGAHVANAIHHSEIPGATLECLVSLDPIIDPPVDHVDVRTAIERCDLIVECAGQEAVFAYGEAILGAGVDLLLTSVGALADTDFGDRLRACRPGLLYLTSGAVGGLDLLGAAASSAAFEVVTVSTTKLPAALVQPWMSETDSTRLRAATGVTEVFSGSAQEAARLFPKSLNVAATVAIAVGSWDAVRVHLAADPEALLTSHVIEAVGPAGQYRFEIRNDPSPENPRTSRVVPFAVLKSLSTALGTTGGII